MNRHLTNRIAQGLDAINEARLETGIQDELPAGMVAEIIDCSESHVHTLTAEVEAKLGRAFWGRLKALEPEFYDDLVEIHGVAQFRQADWARFGRLLIRLYISNQPTS